MKLKETIFTILMLLMFLGTQAQDSKFFTKDSYAKFYSEAPLENIEAHNEQVQSIIDIAKNDVVISMPITGFTFEKSLMQEHFNENYMESDKFPKAEFQGVYTSATPIDMSKNTTYEVMVKGNLTIHGVTKSISTKGYIKVENNTLIATTTFFVKVADYKIEIPRISFKNIAEEVEVSVELKYQPFKS
ncbi:YceI family protein [Marivirga sp. S37H4]|uniref:YceI family protein n=1 Tax=Marivirga aurantiaca TaxID=2802615 RepID=A0A934WZN0_9BACT|nr:YceI family protein [Marivirga aurantiaca]MBK6266159.1 YceI family protein [Marivirga aurantiaca]